MAPEEATTHHGCGDLSGVNGTPLLRGIEFTHAPAQAGDRFSKFSLGNKQKSDERDPYLPTGGHIWCVWVLIPQCEVLVVKIPQARNPRDGHSRVKGGIARVFRKRIQATGSEQCVVRAEENEIKRISEKNSHEYSSSGPRCTGRTVWNCAHSTFRMLSAYPILQERCIA
jgi:hypothetical protein